MVKVFFSKNKVTEYLVNNKKMTDPVAIANPFNDYFINVGKSLAHNIVSQIDPLAYIDKSKNCITDISVTVNDVNFNLSVLQGDFSSDIKLAKVLPFYKADNRQLIQNYRPISFLIFSFKSI